MPPSSFNRGEQVRLPIFRTKVREVGKLPLVSLFVRISRHIVIDQCTLGLGHNLSVNQVLMGVALGCEGLGRPDEMSFGRTGIGGGVTFCRKKFAYRTRLGELGPRRLSRTRHPFVKSFTNLAGQSEHLFPPHIKREGALALSIVILFNYFINFVLFKNYNIFCFNKSHINQFLNH